MVLNCCNGINIKTRTWSANCCFIIWCHIRKIYKLINKNDDLLNSTSMNFTSSKIIPSFLFSSVSSGKWLIASNACELMPYEHFNPCNSLVKCNSDGSGNKLCFRQCLHPLGNLICNKKTNRNHYCNARLLNVFSILQHCVNYYLLFSSLSTILSILFFLQFFHLIELILEDSYFTSLIF